MSPRGAGARMPRTKPPRRGLGTSKSLMAVPLVNRQGPDVQKSLKLGWTGQQNVAYPYIGILFSLIKEGNSDTCYDMDGLEDIMLSERNQTQRNKYCMIPLIGGTKSSQIHRDRKQTRGYQGLRGKRNGDFVFSGHWVLIWDDENILEMDSGDGCTTMSMYSMPLNCTPKNG